MSEPRRCPMCDGGEMVRREGRLEQSGDTYLPTTVWSCALCEYAAWAPALGVRWRSAFAATVAPEVEPLPRRRAA
jgi:hypothetical protein